MKPAQNKIPIEDVSSRSSKVVLCKVGFGALFLLLVGVVAFTFFYYKEGAFSGCDCTAEDISKQASQEKTSEWVRVSIMGYSFEIPLGWQVMDIFPESESAAYSIFIDPRPISSAPRGGPISAISIHITDPKEDEDPYAVLEAKKEVVRTNIENVSEETVTVGDNTLYKYSGMVDFYTQLVYIEEFVFLALDTQSKDTDAVVVTLYPSYFGDEDYAGHVQIAKRIAGSFRND